MASSEVNEFNVKRQAIQSTATWQFEMWRRHTQAQWEMEQYAKETAYRKELEEQLRQAKEKQDTSEARQMVQTKQKQLQDILLKCTHEAKVLEKLKLELEEARERAQVEYQQKCSDIQNRFKAQKASFIAKATTNQARADEMLQRAEFYKQQLLQAQERLQEDLRAFDERKRNMIMESEDDLLRQQTELDRQCQEQTEQIRYLERCKTDLYHQYQRAVLLEEELKAGLSVE